MRLNTPVTQHEHPFPEGVALMSTTDVKGVITYANDAFVKVSGFERAELIGKPHNVVRHPDVPPEAFADMWQTLADGRSWSAIVKNRRKDGDHYWVRANVAPMVRAGRLVGYLSVRTMPHRAEIEAAEALFTQMRNGNPQGLAFYRGLIVHTGWRRPLNTFKLLSTTARVRLPLGLLAGALVAAPLALGVGTAAWLGLSAIAILGVVLADAFIESQITRPLKAIAMDAQQVAAGEQANALHLQRCDDLRRIELSVHQAGLNLHALVADVHAQVAGVQQASAEIAASNTDLAERTVDAAQRLESTSQALQREIGTVTLNAEQAEQANEFATVAMRVASQGGEAMDNVVTTMNQISSSSRRIADIINVIEGIAFQTNLLALNAAVEAARAGEHGKGFAVVATEVRSLAGRSSKAAREIRQLIEDSVGKVDSGANYVAQAGLTMTDVVKQVHQVNERMTRITEASMAQSERITAVGQSMTQLDRNTQQNAAMVEENSAAADVLSAQAQRLLDAIQVFSRQAH